jgi:hypothetical protein
MNIFNEDFITDSFLFLDGVEYFSNNNEQLLNNKYLSQFKNEIIFSQIKEIHDKINKKKNKPKGLKAMLGAHLLLKSTAVIKNEESKKNVYTNLLEDFLNQRMEEENQQKEIEKQYLEILEYYRTEQLIELLRIINSNALQKEKLFRDKNEKQMMFESKLIDFLEAEMSTDIGFTNCNNKNFNMSYKISQDNLIMLKFEKELDVNFIDFVSLVYEHSVYPKWFPFCSHTEVVHQPGKARKLLYMISNLPFINDRDYLIYGFGVNKIAQNRTVLLCVQSVEENTGLFEEYYKKTKSSKYVRAQIQIFGYEIKIVNRNKVHLKGLLKMDPKINFIPQGLLNTVAKRFAEDLFTKMLKVIKNYQGSEFQNKNPSDIDMQFYDFINEEANKLKDY